MHRWRLLFRGFLILFLPTSLGILGVSKSLRASQPSTTQPPNILWITCEDTGPEYGCFGDKYAQTPAIDALAAQGMRYRQCWSNAPVCAPARTTLITGIYPTSFGAQHMRCSRPLPEGFRTLPERLRSAGYYCSNRSKEDYNFPKPEGMWDDSSPRAHWRGRAPGQPFFSVINFTTTHESQIRKRPYTPVHDPEQAPVPPYHPDHPEVRLDWAQYYDRITEMDRQVAGVLQELQQDGLAESTIVFFFGDHGSGMPRSKRWLYQGGLGVGMIVRVPPAFQSLAGDTYAVGTQSERLVGFVDLAPSAMDLAGLPVADELHGHSIFDAEENGNRYLFGFRDRMDERIDSSRAIRDARFLYVRNFMPDRPQGAFLNYMFQTPTTRIWHQQFLNHALNPVQSGFWLPKPTEELYDLVADPHQVLNLIGAHEHQPTRERMAQALREHMERTRDSGPIPEGPWLWEGQIDSSEALQAAWRSGQAAEEPALCLEMLEDPAPIVQYWGAVAARSLQPVDDAVPATILDALQRSLGKSDRVAVVAAEAIERLAQKIPVDETVRQQSRHTLLEKCASRESDWGVRMEGLNALCELSPTRDESNALAAVFSRDGQAWNEDLPERYREYLPRLMERIVSLASP